MKVRNASLPAAMLTLTLALSGCSGGGESPEATTNDAAVSSQPTIAPIVGANGDVSGVPDVNRMVTDGDTGDSGVKLPDDAVSALGGKTPAIPEQMKVHAFSIAEGFFIVLAESIKLNEANGVTPQSAKKYKQSDFNFLDRDGYSGWKPFFSEISVTVTEKSVNMERKFSGDAFPGTMCEVAVGVEYMTQNGGTSRGALLPTVDEILADMTCKTNQ
jgi:hypothetical protein